MEQTAAKNIYQPANVRNNSPNSYSGKLGAEFIFAFCEERPPSKTKLKKLEFFFKRLRFLFTHEPETDHHGFEHAFTQGDMEDND